jgi:hypothetical protein
MAGAVGVSVNDKSDILVTESLNLSIEEVI